MSTKPQYRINCQIGIMYIVVKKNISHIKTHNLVGLKQRENNMKVQYKHTDTTTQKEILSISREIYKGEDMSDLEPTYTSLRVKEILINDFKSNETTTFIKKRINDDFYNLHIIQNKTVSSYLLKVSNKLVTYIDVDILSTWSLMRETLKSIYSKTGRGRILVESCSGYEIIDDLSQICLNVEHGHPPETLLRSKYKLLERWIPSVINEIKDIKIIEDSPLHESDSLSFYIEKDKIN